MKTEMFVIFDTVAKIYNKPFFLVNLPSAQRAAQDLINNRDHEISRNPQDYTMWHLGSYDDETAQFDLLLTPKCLIKFHEVTPQQLEITQVADDQGE